MYRGRADLKAGVAFKVLIINSPHCSSVTKVVYGETLVYYATPGIGDSYVILQLGPPQMDFSECFPFVSNTKACIDAACKGRRNCPPRGPSSSAKGPPRSLASCKHDPAGTPDP